MFDSINKVVSKVLPNMKTNTATISQGLLGVYLANKGFNLEEFMLWMNNLFTSVQSLIVLIAGAGVWFRQLKEVVKPKKNAKK